MNSVFRLPIGANNASGSMQGAGGVGGLLMVNAGSGRVHFPRYDLNGNVMGLVNATNGIISAKYEYGPFGEVFCSVGDMAKVNPFGFSTKYTDNETDLLYYGYRYYSPALGRWLSRDPIEEQGGLNLYGFVNNDPVNKWDKLGREVPAYDSVDANPSITFQFLVEELAENFGMSKKAVIKRIALCASIHKLYDSFKCSGCSSFCISKDEAIKRSACLSSEVAMRAKFLGLKCDYFLPGSIAAGSRKKELGHSEQLAVKATALGICIKKASSK